MYNLAEGKIILYGAGCCGAVFAELLQKSGFHVECFFDRNPDKTNQQIMEIPIKQPMFLDADSLVVVCILKKGKLYEEIAQDLRQLGYRRICHIYELREEKSLFEGQSLILAPDREAVFQNLHRYDNLKNHLEDDLSRQVLEKILEFLLEDVDAEIPAFKIEEQYFAYDIYRRIPEEYVVDCGAFKGDVMRIFLKKNHNQFAHYLAIEPDKSYLPFLQHTADQESDGKIEIKNCALSDKREQLRMRNYAQEDSIVRADGEIEVQSCPLDELMKGRACTFLKIDVEGYDKKAIMGAAEMIREQKPVIAVAAYHRESDFYEIFELLYGLYEDYHFYLRSYMNVQETILYAVPPWRLVKEREDEICR